MGSAGEPDGTSGATEVDGRVPGFDGDLRLGVRRTVGANLASLSRRSQAALQSIIGPDDDRIIVSNTSQVPWRLIASLEIRSGHGTAHGTGWLAGPRCVITCGHCIHDHDTGARATSIVVSPGRYRNNRPFGSLASIRFSVPDQWTSGRQRAWDVGCIHLDEPLGETLGWFGLDGSPPATLPGKPTRTAGYSEFDTNFGRMLQSAGVAQRVAEGRLFYTADTLDGHSGGPIWIDPPRGDSPQVVALHAYDETETPSSLGIEANSGPMVGGRIAELVEEWRRG